MNNQELRQLFDKLCNKLFVHLPNPLDYIDQINNLVFLKFLEDKDDVNSAISKHKQNGKSFKSLFADSANKYRFSEWSRNPDPKAMLKFIYDELFPYFTKDIPGDDREPIRRFFSDTRFLIHDELVLLEIVDIIRPINFCKLDADVLGDAYEYLLERLSSSKRLGSFRTPRHIIRTIVEMVNPKLGDTVLDPACGTAGFLLAAYEHIATANSSEVEEKTLPNGQKYSFGHGNRLSPEQWKYLEHETFYGFDTDPTMVRIATMNMLLHGLNDAQIIRRDSVAGGADEFEKKQFDIVLTNPPFAGAIAENRIRSYLPVQTKDSTILFLGLVMKSLKDGGTAGIIVNEGLLFTRNNAAKEIRRMLLDKMDLQAVVSLPQGVFNPYAGVKTSFLVFKNTGKPTEKVWFYEVENDGFSKGTQRHPLPDKNDIPDLLSKWPIKSESAKSWLVDKKKIEENDYILTASNYKTAVGNTDSHRDPKEILKEIEEDQKIIQNSLTKVKKII
ncbi:type I restriction-modification system subunit M [Patescibacteria group bacterium]|nr:type I restriction-modification system subunit M [Patescibacteria group bacterium]